MKSSFLRLSMCSAIKASTIVQKHKGNQSNPEKNGPNKVVKKFFF